VEVLGEQAVPGAFQFRAIRRAAVTLDPRPPHRRRPVPHAPNQFSYRFSFPISSMNEQRREIA